MIRRGFLLNAQVVFLLLSVTVYPVFAKDINAQLIEAAKAGNTSLVLELLEKGANIEATDDEYQATPLLHAAAKGHAKTVQALLDKGANPKAKDKYGLTAKALAVMFGKFDVLKVLNNAEDKK